jgi:hypothetical protein
MTMNQIVFGKRSDTKGDAMIKWNVYLYGDLITSVWWSKRWDGGVSFTANDIRFSLINHDGYHDNIEVAKA